MTRTKEILRNKAVSQSNSRGNAYGSGISELFGFSSPHLLNWISRHTIGTKHILYLLGIDINNIVNAC